jgi:uncharacterized membrane protein
MLPEPIKKRNVLILTGIVLLILAVIQKPALLLSLFSVKGITHIILMGLSSMFLAFGFHEFANQLLRNDGLPWYARSGGITIFMLLVIVFCIGFALLDGLILPIAGIPPIFQEHAYRYELFGMTVLWITILEWVSYK